ncbi:MAG: copper chaperone PCu(A)C [Hydrogenophilaceae bacterium]|nr:copper chaperone PCu(A)C [Hydrogenophilaceae bacterium]
MSLRNWILPLGLALSTAAGAAEVKIDDAWARATAPGQNVGGVFMTLTADGDLSLVGGSSPAAGTVEQHTKRIDQGMMVMRKIDNIALPKGKKVELAPGGLHIMLIGLKNPLKAGEQVPLTLTVRDAKGKSQQLKVKAEVREMGGGMMQHHH